MNLHAAWQDLRADPRANNTIDRFCENLLQYDLVHVNGFDKEKSWAWYQELKANGKQSGGRFSYNDDKHIVFVSINIEQPQHQFQKNTMLYPGGILDVPLDYGNDKEASIEGFKLALNKKVEVGLWLPSIRARIDLGSWKVTDVMKGDTASVRLLSEKSTNKMLEYKINQYNERLKLVVTMKLQHNSGKVAVQLQYRNVTDQEKKQYQLCRQALTWLQWKQEYKEQSQDGASKKQKVS